MDVNDLEEHCDDIVHGMDCVASFSDRCNEADRGYLLGIGDAYRFLCGAGRNDYENLHADCLSDPLIQVDGMRCDRQSQATDQCMCALVS